MSYYVKGYHYDSAVRKNELLVEKHIPMIARGSKQWLGTGMYFWDNYGNVLYWRKVRQGAGIPVYQCVTVADICLDNCLLDLTDPQDLELIRNLIDEAKKLPNYPVTAVDSPQTLGKVIDFLLEEEPFGTYLNRAKVIKAAGSNEKMREDNEGLAALCWRCEPRLDFGTRIEYCVKADYKSVIQNPAFMNA